MRKQLQTIIYSLACLLLGLTLTACGSASAEEGDILVYYLNQSSTAIESHATYLEGETTHQQINALLGLLANVPDKPTYKAPLSMGFALLESSYENGKVTLNFEDSYKDLSDTTEVLVRAAIVQTLLQLEEVTSVTFYVAGEELYDAAGELVGAMTADAFVNNDGNDINTYEETKVLRYFANAEGTALIGAYREKYYSTNLSLERFIVEELIQGPSGQIEGLYATINPSTKVISVTTKDTICYVNLDETFLIATGNVSTEMAIYSIVNSLAELSGVSKVQILINGEVPTAFGTGIYERNLDLVTTLE